MVAESQAAPAVQNRRAQGRKTVSRKADRREVRFAQLIAQGFPLWKAYHEISGTKKKETCEQQGSRWGMRAAVQSEIQRQRAALTEETAMSRAEKRNHLARVARDEGTPPQVIVSAVAVDNRMTGDDEPFRRAAGDDLRVQFFVLRIGDADTHGGAENATRIVDAHTVNVTPGLPDAEALRGPQVGP